MPTIDLSTPPRPPSTPASVLDALPRRVTLTLPELRHVAERAGGAPLPFEPAGPRGARAATQALEGRLGQSRATDDDQAYAAALAALHDPRDSLGRRGLLGPDADETGLLGAVGLLATPRTALDLDVTAAGIHARSWQRRAGRAVASLSTVDGIVFELAWFGATQWPAEVARTAILPAESTLRGSSVPRFLDVPYALVDAASEAVRTGRDDLVPVLADAAAPVLDGEGRALSGAEVARSLTALTAESRGRLRALVARVDAAPEAVGVVSWTLLADGWHAIRPREGEDGQRVHVVLVDPDDLATELAPVLAEVSG